MGNTIILSCRLVTFVDLRIDGRVDIMHRMQLIHELSLGSPARLCPPLYLNSICDSVSNLLSGHGITIILL